MTRYGHKMYRKLRKAADRRSKGAFWRAFGQVLPSLTPSPKLFLLVALGFGVWSFGLPHLRWEYAYRGTRDAPSSYIWCRYIGPDPVVIRGDDCPVILFRKTW